MILKPHFRKAQILGVIRAIVSHSQRSPEPWGSKFASANLSRELLVQRPYGRWWRVRTMGDPQCPAAL